MHPRAIVFTLSGISLFILIHVVGYAAGVDPPTRVHRTVADAVSRSHFIAPPNLQKVVAFGDSLTDDGTGAWTFTNFTWPTHPAYSNHRFSNGRVYSEYFAESLLLPLDSRAVGGASISTRISSASGPNSSWPVDCILEQIRKYSIDKTHERQTVFIILAGANDIYWGMDEGGTMPDVLEDLQTAVSLLKKIGGRYFVTPTLPPLGKGYPFGKALPETAEFMGRSSTELRQLLLEWSKKDKHVEVADFYTLIEDLVDHPVQFGFDPDTVGDGCIGNGVCDNPEERIWFDDWHPTTRVHKLLSKVALASLDVLTGPRKTPSAAMKTTMWRREMM